MEIESDMFCICAISSVVLYIWDSRAKIISFYVEPHLSEAVIKHDITIKRIPNTDPETYDVDITCPLCGRPSMRYAKIPNDWECLASPGPIISVPLDQIPKSWIIAEFDMRELG